MMLLFCPLSRPICRVQFLNFYSQLQFGAFTPPPKKTYAGEVRRCPSAPRTEAVAEGGVGVGLRSGRRKSRRAACHAGESGSFTAQASQQ